MLQIESLKKVSSMFPRGHLWVPFGLLQYQFQILFRIIYQESDISSEISMKKILCLYIPHLGAWG
jgi:hypothetical protein